VRWGVSDLLMREMRRARWEEESNTPRLECYGSYLSQIGASRVPCGEGCMESVPKSYLCDCSRQISGGVKHLRFFSSLAGNNYGSSQQMHSLLLLLQEPSLDFSGCPFKYWLWSYCSTRCETLALLRWRRLSVQSERSYCCGLLPFWWHGQGLIEMLGI